MLCDIGKIYRAQKKTKEAAYWYEAARTCKDFSAEGDFEEPLCRTLIPLVELTCCYFALGDIERAVACHKLAEEAFPDHPSVVYNRRYFKNRNLL